MGVAFATLGVPAGWLCWLPRADMLGAMGTDMPWWFCTTDADLGGLPPMLEFECCMGAPTIGDDAVCGVFCRMMGDDACA